MTFDWRAFCERYDVPYVERGPNVARNHINIACPFCPSDPSHHMGLSLSGSQWGCWRDSAHRGLSPIRLMMRLAGITYDEAVLSVKRVSTAGDMTQAVAALQDKSIGTQKTGFGLKKPKEFRSFQSLDPSRPTDALFFNYLHKRRYTDKTISVLTKRYGVYACTDGPWRQRIVFLIKCGGLVNWTGRSISDNALVRYKTVSKEVDNNDGITATTAPSECLLWYDKLMRTHGDTLLICEGPFDALKMSVLGRPYGISATCIFTSSISAEQVDLLIDLRSRFRRTYLLLDPDAKDKAFRIAEELRPLGVKMAECPEGVDDPGDMRSRDFQRFLTTLL